MAHDEYKEMLAAAALGTLDGPEVQQLELHLENCSSCRAEHDQWRETVAWLALEAGPLEPPSRVRTELLLKIKTHPKQTSRGNVIPMPARTRTGLQRWTAIAAAIAIVALGLALFGMWRQNRAARLELVRLSQEMEQTKQELARQREAAAIVAAPGARMMELAGTEMAPSAHAMLAFDPSGRAILMAKNLPPPPAGKAYQLWFIAGGNKMPGKVFTTSVSGEGMLNDNVPESARSSAVFAITLESEHGATAPTGQIYLLTRS